MNATRHPAKFTDSILAEAAPILRAHLTPGRMNTAIDPFAGIGKGVRFLRDVGYSALGVELEPEWAGQTDGVACGDWFVLGPSFAGIDAVFTSPTYGNRMADHHDARDDSRRNTYRHALGRPLTSGNSGAMQWGAEYRDFHERAWRLVYDALRVGGLFVVNVSDHIRKGQRVPVVAWHIGALERVGFDIEAMTAVATPRQRQGANGTLRVDGEALIVARMLA